jgi:pimeloyl-ACP methyl ester carboxylesterase
MIDAGGDTIIAASSYGGTVVAEAAARPNVHHLLYISSFLPTVGATHAGVVASPADPVPVRANPDGSVSVVDDESPAFDDRFLHDVSASALIRGAHERLTAQSPAAFTTPTTAAAWQRIPSTYLVCTADRNTDVSLQREHAARATHVVELPTGHHPFLSRPDLVADELRTIASS